MTPPEHEALRRLFERALDLEPGQRAAFLTRECGGDTALRARVAALLAAAEDERFLSEPTASGAASVERLREGPGTRIGPYTLLELLGEGGFGAVFRARQEQPVAREVALKILKLGMDTREVVARFEQERQALALMDHPNIARVFDAGATDTGRPYFVMELVRGRPIVEHCDAHHLQIEERLALFAQVCNAVQHAHGKGIIHRDLKPSNILVGLQDGRAHARIIDFGIAKATSARLTDKTVFTQHQQVIGTLQYMSPEQAEGSLDIDTRTDVYALGVVLYELLTGSTPLDPTAMRDAFLREMLRIVREVEPPKPSTRLSQSHNLLASLAANRRVPPRRLSSLVRGELDWIVMKALEKDRARRYATASAFSDDLQRYLAGEPVVAAPPSTAYRLRKFVLRNRVVVTAGSAVALSLVAGAIAFAWQARVARGERDNALLAQTAEAAQRRIAEDQREIAQEQRRLADEQRGLAEERRVEAQRLQALAEANAAAETRARKRAEATAEFVTDALISSDPNEGGQQDITVAQAMHKAVELIDGGSFRDEPDLEASLRKVIASVLHGNGHADEALPLAERSLAMFEKQSSGDTQDVAVALNLVATIQQDLGRLDRAEPLFERALAMQRRLHPADHADVSMALNNLALVRSHQGRVAEAEPLFAESLAMKQRLVPGDSEDVAMGLNNLAGALDQLGRRAEALPLYERALEMYERLHDSHPQLAMALYNLGQMRIGQGRYADSQSLLDRALAMYRELYEGDHPFVARAISGAGNVRRVLGQLADAERLFGEALAMKQRLYAGDHPAVANELAMLVLVQQERGDAAAAESNARRALEMQRRLHSSDHPDLAKAIDALAGALRDLDRAAEAEPLLAEALDMHMRLRGEDHPDVARALNRLASTLVDLERAPEGQALSERAVGILRRALPDPHPALAAGIASLGLLVLGDGRAAEAEPHLREALDIARRYHGGEHYDVAVALTNMARCLHELKREEESRRAFADGIAMHRRRAPGSPVLASALWRSGKAALDSGAPELALPQLEEAAALMEVSAPGSATLAKCREALATCRARLGR